MSLQEKIIKYNTRHKKGDKVTCIKNAKYQNVIIFNKGKIYIVDYVGCSHCGNLLYPNYTIYGYQFTSNEIFENNEFINGASGISSFFGNVEKYFYNTKKLRK